MHKRRVNELQLQYVIKPAGPILIKSGGETALNPTLPEMTFVRTRHPQTGDTTIYLPGSSLKGVIRSHSERIIRTVLGDNPETCCDPLGGRGSQNCQDRIKSRRLKEAPEQYRELCLACRIFGHMDHASHFLTADAFPPAPIDNLPVRQNVAIDRLSGGVAVGPFDMEVALEGEFHSQLTLYNFELWQVGLLILALRDIGEGRVRLGFAKSRGLGEVHLYLTQATVSYPGQFASSAFTFDKTFYGAGSLVKMKNGAADTAFVRAYDYVGQTDQIGWEVSGAYDPDEVWGRPSLRFGVAPDQLPPATLASNHNTIMGALAVSVKAWAQFVREYKG